MKTFAWGVTFGSRGREMDERGVGRSTYVQWHDVGTELDIRLHPWLIVGVRLHRYGVFVFLGPIAVTFYHRKARATRNR